MTQTAAARKGWYIGQWGALGWAETIVKLAAHVVAFIALLYAIFYSTYTIPQGGRFIEVVVLAILALGLTLAIVDRVIQREIISIVFILINVAAHWGMVYALMTQPGPGAALPIFALLMAIGDIIKLRFFSLTDFVTHTYPGVPRSALFALVLTSIAAYTILMLLGFGGA